MIRSDQNTDYHRKKQSAETALHAWAGGWGGGLDYIAGVKCYDTFSTDVPMCHFSNLTSKRIAPLTLPYLYLENLNPLASTPFPLRVAHVCYVIHIFWLCLEWRSRVCFKEKLPHLHDTTLSHTLYWNYIALRILIQTFHIRKLCEGSIYCTKLISFHPFLFWLWRAFHFLHKL